MIREYLKQALTSGRPQRCPGCDEPLTAEQINLLEGMALCPQCGQLSRLSELRCSAQSVQQILDRPPSGCSIEQRGQTVVVSASCRSLTGFIVTFAFAAFWNGILSMFLAIALAGLYANLVGPLPAGLPPGLVKNGQPQMNEKPMGLSETLFLCLFLTPFVLVGVCMACYSLMCLLGKVEVVLDEFDSYTSLGVGLVRWKRRFDPRQVVAITACECGDAAEHEARAQIELHADRTIKFGYLLGVERTEWLLAALKELLLRSGQRRNSKLPTLPWL